MNVSAQLPLSLKLRDDATFNNFYPGENQTLIECLHAILQSTLSSDFYFYCYGSQSTGKTHLLQACCNCYTQQGKDSMYLPLADYESLAPEMLEGTEYLALLCLDNVEKIAKQSAWEEALFHCYNRIQQSGTRLIIAGISPPQQLEFALPDLHSRISAGVSFQLKALSDENKIEVLCLRAKLRGLELTPEIAQYLLQHYPRDLHALFEVLEKLDQASLAAQRKLTLPFVRDILRIG
jgi:DnaA family protein